MQSEPVPAATRTCDSCGAPVEPHDKFCQACGTPLTFEWSAEGLAGICFRPQPAVYSELKKMLKSITVE